MDVVFAILQNSSILLLAQQGPIVGLLVGFCPIIAVESPQAKIRSPGLGKVGRSRLQLQGLLMIAI